VLFPNYVLKWVRKAILETNTTKAKQVSRTRFEQLAIARFS
jgi:hypothetical protein